LEQHTILDQTLIFNKQVSCHTV